MVIYAGRWSGLFNYGYFFVKPIYESGSTTISQILCKEFGNKVANISVVLMLMGTFVAIVSQFVAGIALITSISSIGTIAAVIIILTLTLAYVIFGGVLGAGNAGVVKTILLYIMIIVSGIISLKLSGGISTLAQSLPRERYFDLFARGYIQDGGEGLSVVLGVISTQAYILPITSAKNMKTAKTGVIISGLLITLIGLAGILIGLLMKTMMPEIASSDVLPLFVINYIPKFIGGIILATLLISIVGSSAAMALGMTSMLCNDIYMMYISPNASDKNILQFSRMTIAIILLLTASLGMWEKESAILKFGYLSMALRASVSFAPLCIALLLPGRVKNKFAMYAVIFGSVFAVLSKLITVFGNVSLFIGVAVAFLIMVCGLIKRDK